MRQIYATLYMKLTVCLTVILQGLFLLGQRHMPFE